MNAQRHRNHDRDKQRHQCQPERRRKRVGDQQVDRRLALEAVAQLPSQKATDELEILDIERLVDAERSADAVEFFLGDVRGAVKQHDGRVARQTNGQRDDQRDCKDHEDRLQQALDEELHH